MSTHTEDIKEMTVEEAMKRGIKLIAGRIEALHPQYFLDEATYAHDVKGTMSVVEEVMGDIEEALTLYASQVREERDREMVEIIKANVSLERVPSDIKTTTAETINELMRLHYEPEHEGGVTCWCEPSSIVKPGAEKNMLYITHNEQRDVIRQFVEERFVSREQAIASLAIGSNQARRIILKALTP